MTRAFSRRFFLGGVAAAGWAGTGMAGAPEHSLRPALRPDLLGQVRVPPAEALVDEARLSGQICYAVADAKTGLVLEGRAGNTGVPPASVAKILTSLYALDRLGPAYRFETTVLARGPVENGRLSGDIVLRGGGDPTLDTNGLARLAAQLKEAGIREVTGRFVVDGSALAHVDTIDRDQPVYVGYSPAICGLNLNYNRVHFEWRRADGKWQVTMDARSDKYRPDVQFARMQIVDRAAPLFTYADRNGRDEWSVAQGALGDGGARWLPVRRPAIYAGEVFQTLARAHGIVLKAPVEDAMPGGVVLARHASPPLSEILRDMLRYSTNLTAEVVGMTASQQGRGSARPLIESAAAMNGWAAERLGLSGVALVDHSGLGGDSRISAAQMVQALVAANKDGRLAPLLKTIHMRDEKKRVDKHHPLKVVAKTGTLNFVSGLAGYLTGPDGTDLAFAIFAADVPRRDALSVAQRERPEGGRAWNGRAKRLQQALLERWGTLYATA